MTGADLAFLKLSEKVRQGKLISQMTKKDWIAVGWLSTNGDLTDEGKRQIQPLIDQGLANPDGTLTGPGELRCLQLQQLEWSAERYQPAQKRKQVMKRMAHDIIRLLNEGET